MWTRFGISLWTLGGFLSIASASQQPFDTKFLFETILYDKLFAKQQKVLELPKFQAILEAEGILTGQTTDKMRSVAEGKEEERPLIQGLRDLEKGLNSTELDEALVKDFRHHKRRAMLKTLGRPLFLMVAECTLFGVGMQILSRIPNGGSFGAGIAGFVLFDSLKINMSLFFQILWYLKCTPVGDPLENLEDKYAMRRRFFTPAFRSEIERRFQDARKDDTGGTKKEYLARVLSLPVQSKPPIFSAKDVTEMLKGYRNENGEEVDMPVVLAVLQHLARFTKKSGVNTIPKLILYLEGPAGMGKTNLVQLLAKSMDLPLIRLQLSDPRFKSTATAPGTLLQGLLSCPHRNGILFLDEFDRVANKGNDTESEQSEQMNEILPFTDPAATTYFDPYVGADVDISHYMLVLSGNFPLKGLALRNRCLVVPLKQIQTEQKIEGINKTILPVLMKSDYPNLTLEYEGLTPDVVNHILRAITDDKDPGFRSIQRDLLLILNKVRLGKLS